MVIGLLGILKAGAAYVPLDPEYPRERLRFMLEDAQVAVLLTQERPAVRLTEDRRSKVEAGDPPSSILDPQMKLICLDTDSETIASESKQNPRSKVKPDNLAYVIYTSGSTGRPKGVAMAHRSLQNLISWQLGNFTTPKAARTLQFTSLSFDVSFQEIFATWCSGGTLLLISEGTSRDTAMLMRELYAHSIERLFLPFRVLQQFAEMVEREKANFTSLKEIITAGEQLQITPQIRLLFKKLDGCRLHNQYGPTETHVVTSLTLEGSSTRWVNHTPVGRPIANTQIYVLDSGLQPVPIGVSGELYIGGAGLAQGYFNRKELTREKFITNPFSGKPGSRLYRTGDLARYLSSGNVEFLGRADSQVKIRGYRIELGEIEAVLRQHPAVKNCIVVVRKYEPEAENKLACYVVLKQQFATSVIELRNYLRGKLPEYLVPSVFAMLAALPLLPNGKVDRRNLPLPDTRLQAAQEFVAPRNEVEELISQTWREVLKVETVGIYDDFFELGGHSLLATQITSRLRDAFDREIPVRVLFDQPTVAELSMAIENLLREGAAAKLPPIVRVPREDSLPLSLNQEHLWRLDQLMPGTYFFNMPYSYRLSGELNTQALEKALNEIIRRHEALRTVFAKVDGKPVQIIKSPSDFQLALVDLRHMAREDLTGEATGSIMGERLRSFNLADGPLIRAKLLRLTDRENLLLITAHHIIADRWSMQVFRRELITLYEAFYHGKSSPLPEAAVQFGDYTCWERRLLEEGLLNDQFMYWKKQLAGALTGSPDEASHDNNSEASFQFNRQSIEIKEALLGKLRLLAKKENSTVFIILLTALIAMLYVSTGQHEIRVGTLVANRRRRESEMTIGHFVNTVILNANVSPELEFKQLLDQIRDVALRAHMYQEFPIEQLIREQESKFGMDRSSLFRVLFNFQKRDFEMVNLPGLTFAPWDVPNTKSEVEPLPTALDLILNLKETSTMLTGAVNVRIAAVNCISAAEVATDLNRILELMVSEPNRLISKLNAIPAAEI
jgi:amino acid adenylation domain-containing protein